MRKYTTLLRWAAALMMWALAAAWACAFSVGGLTIDGLRCPGGIEQAPLFGWQLSSEERGCEQAAYELTLCVDERMEYQAWTSGRIESAESQQVEASGLALLPHTRYYWRVKVWDTRGRCSQSAETAYFDTGLMGDWGQAKWIRAGDYAAGLFRSSGVKNYTIEADIQVDSLGAGICFATTKAGSYRYWRIDLSDAEKPQLVMSVSKRGQADYVLGRVPLDGLADSVRLHKPLHLAISITNKGGRCLTSVNGEQVDNRKGQFLHTPIGIRLGQGEAAIYDNLRVTDDDARYAWLAEDFEQGSNIFGAGEVADGRLEIEGPAMAWQPEGKVGQMIEADMAVARGTAAISFGYEAPSNCFIWQISPDGEGGCVLRKYVRSWSAPMQIEEDLPLSIDPTAMHTWTIEVTGNNHIATYADSVMVDYCKAAPRRVPVSKCAFTVEKGGEAYIDNVRAMVTYPDGSSATVLSEDFEGQAVLGLAGAEAERIDGNGLWHAKAETADRMALQRKSDCPIFYTTFQLDKPVRRAMLYTSALGAYDVTLNGERVGHEQPRQGKVHEELKPGWTDYLSRVLYSTHDVTRQCRQGRNSIGATVASGWLTGKIAKDYYGTKQLGTLAFIGRLIVTYADGTTAEICTDETWQADEYGPLISSDIYNGDYYDARRPLPWEQTDSIRPFATLPYAYKGAVEPVSGHYAISMGQMQPISAAVQEAPQDADPENGYYGEMTIAGQSDGRQSIMLQKGQAILYDFGQNMAAVPRLRVKGDCGTKVTLLFGEALNESGLKARYNDGPRGSLFRANMRKPEVNALQYVLSGDGEEEYRPVTTCHGYRYCQVTATADVEVISLMAEPITSANCGHGSVTTDNESVNRLFDNIMWSQMGNMASIPTDCPSRDERLGWTGDIQVFATTAMYNADVAGMLRKWLIDMRHSQRADGAYADIAPNCLNAYGGGAWADAGITVAWDLYMMTGQKQIIEEHYESMAAYMAYLGSLGSAELQHPGGEARYGDWLAPEHTDKRYISQAYYAYEALLMQKMAKLLSREAGDGYDTDAQEYGRLAADIRAEMQQLYFSAEGLANPTQAACSMALCFELCADKGQQRQVAAQLAELVRSNDYRISTGFLGTAYISKALTDNGYPGLAYSLLLQRKYPSWLYCVDQGATTIWEYWDSYRQDTGFPHTEINSFNHYAYGSVGEWMYSRMAGIRTSEEVPGFKKIIFEPWPDERYSMDFGRERICEAAATVQSPYGQISARWTRDGQAPMTYSVIVPGNTTAEVRLPSASAASGYYVSGDEECAEYLGYRGERHIYAVKSGSYEFTAGKMLDTPTEEAPKAQAWPNPTDGQVSITTDGDVQSVTIYDMAGRKVMQSPAAEQTVDLSRLPAGIYILAAETEKGTAVTKVVKR